MNPVLENPVGINPKSSLIASILIRDGCGDGTDGDGTGPDVLSLGPIGTGDGNRFGSPEIRFGTRPHPSLILIVEAPRQDAGASLRAGEYLKAPQYEKE